MKRYDPRAVAAAAVSANPTRPATAMLHDSPDARLVMFRIEPGQEVAAHTSPSTVLLVGVEGRGTVSGADGAEEFGVGDVVAYEPNEIHAMKAAAERFVVMAVITPRPGGR